MNSLLIATDGSPALEAAVYAGFQLAARAEGGVVVLHVVEAILATADEIDAEPIVIGSNRHGALETTFFGSVSKELLKRAPRRVPVVHPIPAPVGATA